MSICTIRNAHSNMMKFINNKVKLPKYLSKNEYYPLMTDQVRIIEKDNKKVINQNFIQIPLSKFKERIKQVSKKERIECVEMNEGYTSLASFYDYDECKEGENFTGKRVKRGLYITGEGE